METTPYYFYDFHLLGETLEILNTQTANANFHVHYALKANHNKQVLKAIASKGLGADCVSGAEIQMALEAGIPSNQIVFAGVGKTDAEIRFALKSEISMINCESLEEILVVNEIANELDVIANIALRLNPDVNPQTHEKITTGLSENKFGLTEWEYNEVKLLYPTLRNTVIHGLHFHIGSQITNMRVFEDLCDRVNQIIPCFEEDFGPLMYLNMGGGLGVDYENPTENPIPDFENYFNTFKSRLVVPEGVPVHFELGRSIVAQCGTLFSRVLFVKRSATKQFAILEAGMTELLRPAMYGAQHKIEKYNEALTEETAIYDVVGPICESSDCFGQNIELPVLKRGDLIAIRSCGAYAESMSLRYNGRTAIPTYPNPLNATKLKTA